MIMTTFDLQLVGIQNRGQATHKRKELGMRTNGRPSYAYLGLVQWFAQDPTYQNSSLLSM